MVPLREILTGRVEEEPGVRLMMSGWFSPAPCQQKESQLE